MRAINESIFVKNKAISNRVDGYLRTYRDTGGISFELTEREFQALQKLTKSFRAESKTPGFDVEAWSGVSRQKGLFDDEKATHVFAFLTQVWSSATAFTAFQTERHVVVQVRSKNHTQ